MTDRSKATTHAADCWSWGPGHYKCAVREIERLRKMHQDAYQRGLQAGSRGLREMYDAIQEVKRQDAWGNTRLTEALMAAEERAERAEAENKRLREETIAYAEQVALPQAEQPAEQEFHRVFEANESLEESLAEQFEVGRDELLPCAWCGSPAASIGMAGIPEPYVDREMFTCSNEECPVGEASFSRNQWNRRDHPPARAEAVRLLKAIVEVANDVGEKHGRIRRIRELDALLEQAEQFLAQHGGQGDE